MAVTESVTKSVLVKFQAFAINGSNGVCVGVCLVKLLWRAITEFVADSVIQAVFSLRLWQWLFLVKFQAFVMNGNDRVFYRVCSKASGFSYKHENFTISRKLFLFVF